MKIGNSLLRIMTREQCVNSYNIYKLKAVFVKLGVAFFGKSYIIVT